MNMNFALKFDVHPKPTTKSSANEKKLYEDWEHSNSCCLMIMENHMKDSVYASIPKIVNAKDFLYAINKKYKKFSKNEKNELLNTLHSTFYNGTSGVREHIDKILVVTTRLRSLVWSLTCIMFFG